MRVISGSHSNFGMEPTNSLTIVGVGTFTDKDTDGGIESLSPLTQRLDAYNQASKSGISVVLTENSDNTKLLSIANTALAGKKCILTQTYEGTPAGLTGEILAGEIEAPIIWNEQNKTLSFTFSTPIDDSQIGYAVTGDALANSTEDLDGKGWPICFGRVLRVPAIRVTGLLKGTTQEPIDCQNLEGSGVGVDVEVTNGDKFEQSVSLDLMIGHDAFTGTFNGNTLTVETSIVARYDAVSIDERDTDDIGNVNKQYLWITDADYAAGVRLAGLWCYIEIDSAQYLNYCVHQKGTRCHFKYAWGELLDDTSGVTIEASKYGLTDWGWCQIGDEFGYLLGTAAIHAQMDAQIPSGSSVFLENDVEDVYYIYNAGAGDSVPVEVMGYRDINNKKKLVAIPSSYYTIENDYDPIDMFDTGEGGDYPDNCSVIKLDIDLEFFEQEGWDIDTLYISAQCDTQKYIERMQNLIGTYTDFSVDSTSFDAANTTLTTFPADFAIFNKRNVMDLCKDMAFQIGCGLFITDDTVYIKQLFNKTVDVSGLTLDDDNIDLDSIQIYQSNYLDIITSLTSEYYIRYNEKIKKYVIEENTINFGIIDLNEKFFAHTNLSNIKQVTKFWVERMSRPWRKIKFITYLDNVELEVFDWFTLNITDDLLGTGSTECMVSEINHDTLTGKITIEAWLPIMEGTTIESEYAFHALAGDLTDPTTGLATIDYYVDTDSLLSSGNGDGGGGGIDIRGSDTDFDVDSDVAVASSQWGRIIESLTYPDYSASTSSILYNGRSWYTVRLISNELEAWVEKSAYTAGDIIAFPGVNDTSYQAKVDIPVGPKDGDPATTPEKDNWEELIDVRVQYAIGAKVAETYFDGDPVTAGYQHADLRNCMPWFTKGQVIPIIELENEYYINLNLAFTGISRDSSIRFDDNLNIVQAVFR